MLSEFSDFFAFVLAPQILNGLVIGVGIILMALGLTIIFGLLDVINMAHGAFYALGGFLLLILLNFGINFWLCLALVPLLVMPVGFVTERLVIQRVFHHQDRHTLTLLLTFGLSLILEDLYRVFFGPDPHKPPTPIGGATEVFGVLFPNYRLFLVVLGAAVIAAIALFMFKSDFGARIRAATHDRDMAASLGVPVRQIYSMTFAFGLALAAFSGVLLGPIYAVYPTMGHGHLILAFAVVIVGGMNSIMGTVVAGLLLTQVSSIVSIFISPVWADVLVLVAMVVVLIVRPQGLFGSQGSR